MDNENNQTPESAIFAMIGKTTHAIFISSDETSLGFSFTDGSCARWDTYGDCCSETWFADIVGVEALIQRPIVKIETIDMSAIGYGVDDGRSRQDSDSAYGMKITSDRGICDIVYRNSSNGYYGGEMSAKLCDAKEFSGWTAVSSDFGAPDETLSSMPEWRARIEAQQLEKTLHRKLPKASLRESKPGRFKNI
jgi:hypothetical protein